MQCKNCGFLVPQNLRFAIMRNFCPQCGEKLFTEVQMNHISMIQSRVISQSFASGFEEQELYDVALFIYNEITNGYGQVLLDQEIKKIIKAKETIDSEEMEPEVEDKENSKKIKEQIRAEEAARVASERMVTGGGGEDQDDKVKRLKELAKRTNINKRGASVRRVETS